MYKMWFMNLMLLAFDVKFTAYTKSYLVYFINISGVSSLQHVPRDHSDGDSDKMNYDKLKWGMSHRIVCTVCSGKLSF